MVTLKLGNMKILCEEAPILSGNKISGIGLVDTMKEDENGNFIDAKELQSFLFVITDETVFSLKNDKGENVEFDKELQSPVQPEIDILMGAAVELYEKQLAQDEEILTTQLAIAELYELQEG